MPRALLFVCLTIVAAGPLRLSAAGAVTQDVPVPGGTAAMARSLGIEPSPDRARFVAELARLTHPSTEGKQTTRAKAASQLRRRVSEAGTDPPDIVPIPLSVALWSTTVFRRPVAPEAIVAAIIADSRAAHLCYGLAGLDDETLQFFVDHPAVISHLYERQAAVFAAFGASLRIRDNRVMPAGGPAAADLWEAIVGESLARPQPFVHALLGQDQGRLAYLYDVIAALDDPRQAFAIGSWIKDPAARLKRFRALVAANRGAIPQWVPAKLPFTRPLHDVASILMRTQVQPDGSPSFPSGRSAWAWVFDGTDVPSTPPPATAAATDGPIDAAWLAQMIVPAETRDRGDRLDQLAFGQRVFHDDAGPGALGDVLTAIRAFPRFRMLMLTLERVGVREPSLYATAARRARQLSNLDNRREFVALAQFQGALALIARMVSVRTLDRMAAESLITSLVNIPTGGDGRYAGAIGKWMQQTLRPALPAGGDFERALVDALAGGRSPHPDGAVELSWEGNVYRLDIAAAEARRLGRIREKQGGLSIDKALSESSDETLADVLTAWVYAVSIADVNSPVLLTGNTVRRHDFGAAPAERGRQRTAWALPRQEIAVGVPWHVIGSLLGLDVALSGLALRRVSGDSAIEAPTLSTNERDAFAAAVALLNPFDLRDRDRDTIATGVERGHARVAALAEDNSRLQDIVSEIHMDGWRTRALQWTIAHDPERIGSMFSMTELLFLGRAPLADLDAWGMLALASSGCLCTRMAPPSQWRLMTGRPQLGLMAETVTDLNLHVAVTLHDLQIPAAVAKAVLTAAVQDFIDEVRPTDFNDWLTLVRTAQSVSRERIEDYMAVATSDGPLAPQSP